MRGREEKRGERERKEKGEERREEKREGKENEMRKGKKTRRGMTNDDVILHLSSLSLGTGSSTPQRTLSVAAGS